MATKAKLPSRLHHTAYVSRDLEATRRFYEEVIGLPLLATWCEKDMLFGAERTYAHCFFGLGDGGALAFFQFAEKGDQDQFGPKMPFTPFHHIALNVDREVEKINREALGTAHNELKRWLKGDHTSNNTYR
jgi:catechol 2,3-dioxygenase-like lactoylglutathione lyase family enzyme